MRTKSATFGNKNKAAGNGGNKKWRTVGTIFERKDGSGYFMKANENFSLEEGQTLNLETPQSKIERLVQLGHLTEAQAEERLSNIPETIKFDVVLPPPR